VNKIFGIKMQINTETNTNYNSHLIFAINLFATETTCYQVKRALTAKGLDETTVNKIADEAEDIYIKAANKKANKNIMWGCIWFAGGTLITLITYNAGGSKFVITYGAIIGGLIQFGSGIYQKSKI
jgi:hypothetical protein